MAGRRVELEEDKYEGGTVRGVKGERGMRKREIVCDGLKSYQRAPVPHFLRSW